MEISEGVIRLGLRPRRITLFENAIPTAASFSFQQCQSVFLPNSHFCLHQMNAFMVRKLTLILYLCQRIILQVRLSRDWILNNTITWLEWLTINRPPPYVGEQELRWVNKSTPVPYLYILSPYNLIDPSEDGKRRLILFFVSKIYTQFNLFQNIRDKMSHVVRI